MSKNLISEINTNLAKVKKASQKLGLIPTSTVKKVLNDLAREILADQKKILAANAQDLKKMDPQDSKYSRIQLTPKKLQGIADDLKKVAQLPSPLNQMLEKKTLPNGLFLKKMSVPLGVIGIVYEARPNVTIDVFAICLKSGNASVLKGGSDAYHSSGTLFHCIQKVLRKNKIDPNITYLLPPDREAVSAILNARDYVDLIIPRGGRGLIDFVRENSKVPVIETGAGVVHTFFDETGDLKFGQKIIENAKVSRPSACNALDTLLIHEKRLVDLPKLLGPLTAHNVEIFADAKAYAQLKARAHSSAQSAQINFDSKLLHKANSEDFGREFLSLKLAIKTVKNIDEAIEHISRFGSKHSEAIISKNQKNIQKFLNEIDAACVYANTSTAFSDGGQFGMGAEIGISTQKLHARGPMALKEMTSYKWIVEGSGQIRN